MANKLQKCNIHPAVPELAKRPAVLDERKEQNTVIVDSRESVL